MAASAAIAKAIDTQVADRGRRCFDCSPTSLLPGGSAFDDDWTNHPTCSRPVSVPDQAEKRARSSLAKVVYSKWVAPAAKGKRP